MKFIFCSFFLLVAILHADEEWDKLIHNTNNKNQISSKEFFISDIDDPSSKEELDATVSELNGIYGEEIACNYPARYNYLKKNNFDIPNYNILKCDLLNDFINGFKKDKISLVFTSEYVNNPSSIFGHTMLLFSDDKESLELGDAVHFLAVINKEDDFFTYAYKTFTGKYNGYFMREPFYKKKYEYNTIQQRYMYVYRLDLSKQEIKTLIYHLFELRKATFKYYLLDVNCATVTSDILDMVSHKKRSEKLYYLPIDTLRDNENIIIEQRKFIPLINKLDLLLNDMTENERLEFFSIIKSRDDIDENTPDIVKEAMSYYTVFSFKKLHKVSKNYDNIMKQAYIPTYINDNSLNPLKKIKPTNFKIGYYNRDKLDYLNLAFRPLLLDSDDIQINNMQQSEVSIFSFDLIVNNDAIKLKELNLISLKSFTTSSNYYKPISWSLYSGINRENIDFSLKVNNEIGIGKTFLIYDKITTNILLHAGLDNIKPYIKPYIDLNVYLTNNAKIGISSLYKKYNNEYYYKSEIFFTFRKKSFIYTIQIDKDASTDYESYLVNIKYNF